MALFTKKQIDELVKRLAEYGIKTSELVTAHPMTGDEYIMVVQEGENRKITAQQLNAEVPPGIPGESAYQVAVRHGFSGTEAEWLASLKGDTGAQGIQGPQGLQGNSGYTGAAGELEVVNNLTDGGATKALSAEMGKALNDSFYVTEDVEITTDTSSPLYGKYVNYDTGYRGIAANFTCTKSYSLEGIERIVYELLPSNIPSSDVGNAAIVAFFSQTRSDDIQNGYGYIKSGSIQGNASVYKGVVEKADFPSGAKYVEFTTIHHPSYPITPSVTLYSKKFTERVEFTPIQTSAEGTEYAPLIANANPNNSGNGTDIRSNSAIPVSKGDVVTVSFNKVLSAGQYLRYIFVGSDNTTTYTALANHRTERTPDDGQLSNRYIISSDATQGICIGLRLKNADGTTQSLQPYTQYNTGDLVVTVQKADSLAGRLGNLEEPNAYVRNKDRAGALDAACRFRKNSNSSKDFQFLIITDSHDDNIAVLNGVHMANGFETIDAIIHLGDMTGNAMTNKEILAAFTMSEANSKKPFYNVIGNHEAGTYNVVGAVPSQEHMYDVLIAPMVDKGYLLEGEYTEDKCYYYHDFTSHNIRLIVLNEYDGTLEFDTTFWEPVTYSSSEASIVYGATYQPGAIIKMVASDLYYDEYCFRCKQTATIGPSLSNPGDCPKYIYEPKRRFISQAQAQWFVETLLDTPANYSVVIAMHQAFSRLTTTQTNKKFCQNFVATGANSASNLMVTDFIADAVDAFVNGRNYSQTVEYVVNNETLSYDIAANFTLKNSGVKFMCYLGGHSHKDLIWKHDTYNQWQVAPVCSNAEGYHQCPGADIRRSMVNGPDYDCLTTIAFNTEARTVSLTKLGVNVTEDMELRDYEKLDLN